MPTRIAARPSAHISRAMPRISRTSGTFASVISIGRLTP